MASVSTDFLYRQPELRIRIYELRTHRGAMLQREAVEASTTTSGSVRALSAQIKALRARHGEEVKQLKMRSLPPKARILHSAASWRCSNRSMATEDGGGML
jgi:hypothetical protein